MRRREFITLVGGAAAWPVAARGQQPERMRRIGVLSVIAESGAFPRVEHFQRGLHDLGYTEGRNILLMIRSADGHIDRLKHLVKELVAFKPDVVLAVTLPAALAALKETASIPIVFVLVTDPVEAGLVDNIAKPARNISGLSLSFDYSTAKRLELFKAAVGFSQLAVLINPDVPIVARRTKEEVQVASASLQATFRIVEARNLEEIRWAFSEIVKTGINSVFITGDGMFYRERRRLAEAASLNRIATMFQDRAHVDAGGLMSYGPSFDASFYRAAVFVDKILKGAKVADLPVEQPTKFEFLINLKTARTIGLEIPATVLALADEVIE